MLALVLWIKNWLQRQEGQDLVEYALLLGLIALICVAAITAAGGSIQAFWETISSTLAGVDLTP